MKKLILITIVTMGVFTGIFAQDKFDNNPRVKEMRKEFYNKELQFTDAESKAFWPLFEQHQEDERKLKRQYRANAKVSLMTDEDAEKHLQGMMEYDKKKLELKEAYVETLSKVLPVRKVAMLGTTERKFKATILKKVKENRRNRDK